MLFRILYTGTWENKDEYETDLASKEFLIHMFIAL